MHKYLCGIYIGGLCVTILSECPSAVYDKIIKTRPLDVAISL